MNFYRVQQPFGMEAVELHTEFYIFTIKYIFMDIPTIKFIRVRANKTNKT